MASRETDLERLRGQLRTLEGQVALATIFLTLVQSEPELPQARVEFELTGYAGHDDGARCPAADDLAAVEGEALTICVSVENIGDAALVAIAIRDSGLDLDDDDFVVLAGSLAGPLQPAERLLGYFEAEAGLERWPAPVISAVPVDDDGERLRITVRADYRAFDYVVSPDESLPTFGDGLRGSWSALVTLGQLGVLALGVAIPFLWVAPLAVGLFWLSRRAIRSRRAVRSRGAAGVAREAEDGVPEP